MSTPGWVFANTEPATFTRLIHLLPFLVVPLHCTLPPLEGVDGEIGSGIGRRQGGVAFVSDDGGGQANAREGGVSPDPGRGDSEIGGLNFPARARASEPDTRLSTSKFVDGHVKYKVMIGKCDPSCRMGRGL